MQDDDDEEFPVEDEEMHGGRENALGGANVLDDAFLCFKAVFATRAAAAR